MPEWVNIAMLFIMPASAIWVYFDALSNGIGRSENPPEIFFSSLWNRSPGAWASLALLFWLPFFFSYVSLRPQLKGAANEDAPPRGWLFGICMVAYAATVLTAVVVASRVPACDSHELTDVIANATGIARIEPKGGTGSARSRTCTYLARAEDGARSNVTLVAKSNFGGYSLSVESSREMATCNDPDYLREVGRMLAANGVTQIRSAGEVAATDKLRTCALVGRESDGEEVRLKGTIAREGTGIRLDVESE